MEPLDHTLILGALKELPYPVGKQTLLEILSGAVTKRMATSNIYMDLESYGTLKAHSAMSIGQWIDRLQAQGCILATNPPGQPHMRVLKITPKGLKELRTPTLTDNSRPTHFNADVLDDASKLLIEQFGFFLTTYNDEQRHAIVSPKQRILCVAGAGTGKTTVLTKRIEFLVRYRGVDPGTILAITFTRKARAEMQARLAGINADVTTFNGFCERLLRAHGQNKPMITYGQKIKLFHEALVAEHLTAAGLALDYFTDSQRKGATRDELERRLMGDVYSLIDHYANEDEELPRTGKSILASTLLAIARQIQRSIEERGLRDYAGQVRDALSLLRRHPDTIPRYAHILVDEYQDVNVSQERLLSLLHPDNLFVVGDPRQSIFGWRGSQIRYIAEFEAETTIQLRTNYRSRPKIVELMNRLIVGMQLPDLTSGHDAGGVVQLLKYQSEDEELAAIATLLSQATHQDLFVLARTNRQLQDLSALLNRSGVAHSIKHEEDETAVTGIVLATVHAIKGLEASVVIVLGATSRYFPCKVSDHPVVDLIKDTYVDREEEERRLLYVAVSRAKELLIIAYTTTPTYFLDGALGPPAAGAADHRRPTQPYKVVTPGGGRTSIAHRKTAARNDVDDGDATTGSPLFERLRAWRARIAKQHGVPAYLICTDRTLQELAELRPQHVAEMRGVYGLGDAKLRRFGPMLVEELRET
jgi:superfamily I DNA/RNA helicase